MGASACSDQKAFKVIQGIDFKKEFEVTSELTAMRRIYAEEGNAELIKVQGKFPVDKVKLLDMIRKLPSRERQFVW